MRYFGSFLTAVIFIVLCGKTYAQDNVIDEVIWVVGDDVILRSDVEKARLEMMAYREQIEGDPYCVIPENMAIQKLYLHQAKLDSIEVTDSQVYPFVEHRINFFINNLGSKEKLEEYFGKPLNAIREELRKSAREENMMSMVQKSIVKKVKVTPTDVRAFYNRIPQDSLPFIPTTVEVEIITQEPRVAVEEIDDIKQRLRDFTEQITSGKREFSTLARMYSEHESAKHGGEMGFYSKTSLLPEFATVAFELNDPKKVSRIVETEYGFHLIQLIEKRGDRINVRQILLKPRVSKEDLSATTLKLDSIRNDIASGKYQFEDSVLYISHDRDTRNNKGLMVNTGKPDQMPHERVGTSRFEMEELPPEVAKVVNTMQVGDISRAFTYINSKQREVIAIVKLKSRIMGHKASLSDDYQALRTMVEQEKQAEVLKKWLDKKIQDTYIRINDNWKNCDFQMQAWPTN